MYIIIVNPVAGKGKAMEVFRRIQKEPGYEKKKCRSFFTEEKGHAEKMAVQLSKIHRESLKGMIVIGGDGTLHEVVNGLKYSPDVPIGFIPSGSGNDFARGINLKEKGVQLFHSYVTTPKGSKFFLGSYTLNKRNANSKRTFINSIGFGLDGVVVAAANDQTFRLWTKKLKITKLTYTLALLRSISQAEPISMDLTLDGKRMSISKAMMVTITNHPYYGGGMKIAPRAKISRNDFSILVVKPISKMKLMALFISVFFGLHTKMREVEEWRASDIEISSNRPLPYQVDGQSGTCYECSLKKAETSTTFYLD